jgi:hypothetical protein
MAGIFGILRVSRWLSVLPAAALGMVLLETASLGLAQTSAADAGAAAAPQDLETALHQMADRADVIFVGRVTAVKRQDGGDVASGVVEIDFQVDQAVRGCAAGTPYALREWAGLWEGDDRRYRVGERLLMLLHAPGAGGMSSPVDGLDGAIPIVRGGDFALAAGSSARVSPPAVDLRWVGVKILHPVSYSGGAVRSARPAGQVVGAQPRARAAVAADSAAGSPLGTEAVSVSLPAQQASVDVVVGMLTSWQKAR